MPCRIKGKMSGEGVDEQELDVHRNFGLDERGGGGGGQRRERDRERNADANADTDTDTHL
jgi:hypothetical protein